MDVQASKKYIKYLLFDTGRFAPWDDRRPCPRLHEKGTAMTHASLPAFEDRTVGEIAASLPGATAVFRQFKLDFCCGGDVRLAEAAAKRGVDLEAIRDALAGLDQDATEQAPEDTDALINHILTRYHETHRRDLPELIRLAVRVEAVHRENPEAPAGLGKTLDALLQELEEHMGKEEAVLFPLMRSGGHPMIVQPIAQMRHDHDDHGALVRQLEEIARGFVLPAGACRSWQALYAGTAKLVDDLMEHIHLENNLLFPRFERRAAI